MTIDRIWIFGDSYADSNNDFGENLDRYDWTYLLHKKYNVTNYAISGTGPHYSFKKYFDHVKSRVFGKNDIIIFIVSINDRIHFHKSEAKEITGIGWDEINSKTYVHESSNDQVKQYYKDWFSEINFYYLTNLDEIHMSFMKNVSFLYCVSQFIGLKTIVFSVSDDFIFKLPINNNFYYLDKRLSNISQNEIFAEERKDLNFSSFRDKRINHFSKKNHKIFFNNLIKIIENKYDELETFQENFLSVDDVALNFFENTEKGFIYT